MSVDESLDECRRVTRQVYTNVDESKSFSLIGRQIFNFVALSVIIVPHNVLTPHISKTHLHIFSLNARELEWN